MVSKQFGDTFIESLNGADETAQLPGRGFHDEAVGFDNGGVGGERSRSSDLIESFLNDGCFAAVMAAVEGP
jgi:hypothetical protein